MRIYMDVCCLFRPFDEDRTQDRIRREADAIFAILELCKENGWKILDSEMIDFEMATATNHVTAKQIKELFPFAAERAMLGKDVEIRAIFFQCNGIDIIDSYHLALAETSGADVFLTTDDRFLRKANRIDLKIRVENPETWIVGAAKNG